MLHIYSCIAALKETALACPNIKRKKKQHMTGLHSYCHFLYTHDLFQVPKNQKKKWRLRSSIRVLYTAHDAAAETIILCQNLFNPSARSCLHTSVSFPTNTCPCFSSRCPNFFSPLFICSTRASLLSRPSLCYVHNVSYLWSCTIALC